MEQHEADRDWLFVSGKGWRRAQCLANDPRFDRIMADVLRQHHIGKRDLLSESRLPHLVRARQELAGRAVNETRLSLESIGKRMNRDHTTILYHSRQFARKGREAQV
jgi:chromosomal replication initiation ATPase DnaA